MARDDDSGQAADLRWRGQDGWMTIGFRWRKDRTADSEPNSMTNVFRWMKDWAADSDLRLMTTGFQWIIGTGWAREPNRLVQVWMAL